MAKAPTHTEKSKKQRDNTKKRNKNFDYTTITDRFRTVSWSDNRHPTDVVKPVNTIRDQIAMFMSWLISFQ